MTRTPRKSTPEDRKAPTDQQVSLRRDGSGQGPQGSHQDGYSDGFHDSVSEAAVHLREGRLDEGIALLEQLRETHGDDPRIVGRLHVARTRLEKRSKDHVTTPPVKPTPLPTSAPTPTPTAGQRPTSGGRASPAPSRSVEAPPTVKVLPTPEMLAPEKAQPAPAKVAPKPVEVQPRALETPTAPKPLPKPEAGPVLSKPEAGPVLPALPSTTATTPTAPDPEVPPPEKPSMPAPAMATGAEAGVTATVRTPFRPSRRLSVVLGCASIGITVLSVMVVLSFRRTGSDHPPSKAQAAKARTVSAPAMHAPPPAGMDRPITGARAATPPAAPARPAAGLPVNTTAPAATESGESALAEAGDMAPSSEAMTRPSPRRRPRSQGDRVRLRINVVPAQARARIHYRGRRYSGSRFVSPAVRPSDQTVAVWVYARGYVPRRVVVTLDQDVTRTVTLKRRVHRMKLFDLSSRTRRKRRRR